VYKPFIELTAELYVCIINVKVSTHIIGIRKAYLFGGHMTVTMIVWLKFKSCHRFEI
jgi:hypothetical protein